MKNIIYLFAYLLTSSCSTQNTIIDATKKDIVLFNFSENNISLPQGIYNSENYSVVINDRYLVGSRYGKYNYTLIKNKKDTMNIKCYCGQEENIYFKNLKFTKGNYELSFDFPKKYNSQTKKYERKKTYTFGKHIKTKKETQKILFKNADYKQLRNPKYKNLYFKSLKFIELDINDTVNVNLKKI